MASSLRGSKRGAALSIVLLLVACFSLPVLAHAADDAVWEVKITGNTVQSWLRVPAGLLNEFDLNNDGRIADDELKPEIIPILNEKVWVESEGVRGELKLVGGPSRGTPNHSSRYWIRLELRSEATEISLSVSLLL